MEQRRRLGRGLEDISHYFISQDQESADTVPLIIRSETKCQVVSVVDLFNSYRGASFTLALAAELCNNGIKILIIDTDTRFPGIAFTQGHSIPGFLIRHYSQNQYQSSDLIRQGRSGIRILAPRLCEKEISQMKRSEISLILKTLTSVEKEVDVIIQRQHESRFRLLIEDGVFIVPAFHAGMIRAYREIKSFISGIDKKGIGIVISDAADEKDAKEVYEKMSEVISANCGIKPYFCGYLSDITNFPMSAIVQHIKEVVIHSRDVGKERKLFFDRVQYLIGSDNMRDEEIAGLLR